MTTQTQSMMIDEMPTGNETVLVVDDNEQTAALASNILRKLGYAVICVTDGASVERLPAEVLAGIELVLTDVVMPHLHGPAMIERLFQRELKPAVIYMSGYLQAPSVGHTADGRATFFMAKPWGPRDLALTARRALDARVVA